MSETKPVIRFSEMRSWMWCRRNWYNAYYLGLGPKGGEDSGLRPPTSASVGTMVHYGIECYYNGTAPTPAAAHLGTPVPGQEPGSEHAAEWQKAYDLATIMLQGYDEWIADNGYDQGEVTYGTEVEVDWDLGPGSAILRCHIDRIVEDRTFARWIVEDTKSVDTISKDASFTVEHQLLTYILAVRNALDLPVSYARHNMLRRVKRTGRATPPFYAREEIRPSTEQLVAHEAQVRGVVAEILAARARLDFAEVRGQSAADYPQALLYPNPSRDCGWRCKFLPVCAAHDDGSDISALRSELYEPYDANRHKKETP